MATLVSEESTEVAEERGGTRALVLAREMREANLRTRGRRRLISAGIVAASLAVALGYGLFVVEPRYAAETRFSVRGSTTQQVAATQATSALSPGAGIGFVDGFAVNDFLQSRDGMQQLARRVDLPRLLHVDGAPSSTSNGKAAGSEALYRAYIRTVSAKFNMVEQENVVEVSAFSPQASQQIAEALIVIAQDFVERMDEQGVRNTLDVDAEQLRKAEEQSVAAANAVAAWRASNRDIDPDAESKMVMVMIGQIEQELTTAKINYEKVAAFGNPDHPMLQPARQQVVALQRQLDAARARLTGGGNSQAARLNAYERLKNAQTFADNNLAASRDAFQQASRETTRLRRYLSVIARPIGQDVPSSPNLSLLAIEGGLAGLVLAFVASLVFRTERRRKY